MKNIKLNLGESIKIDICNNECYGRTIILKLSAIEGCLTKKDKLIIIPEFEISDTKGMILCKTNTKQIPDLPTLISEFL